VPAREGRSSMVQADLTVASGGERLARKQEVRTVRTKRRGHDFLNTASTNQASQLRVQYQRAGPPGQLLHG